MSTGWGGLEMLGARMWHCVRHRPQKIPAAISIDEVGALFNSACQSLTNLKVFSYRHPTN